jgi:ABC-type branched-subunit amino acid transport system ATPase component/branched-subunit amino acid ABC-type transport system permease component
VIGALELRFDLFAIGAMAGLGYAILASGLILVYRSSRLINLAHGQIGAFAGTVFLELAINAGLPYPLSLLGAVAAGAATAILIERTLIRPLASRSPLAVLAATIGVIQLLLVAQLLLPDVIGTSFPVPVHVNWEINGFVARGEHLVLIIVGPVALVALTTYLTRSRYGLAIRAVAENRDAARLAGMPIDRVATIVWGCAGALAAVGAILTTPLSGSGVGTANALGPELLLRALIVGLVGRLTSIRATIAGGIAIGIVEAILIASFPTTPGMVNAVLFVIVLVLLLVRARDEPEIDTTMAAGVDPVPLPEALRRDPRVKRLRIGAILAAGAVAAALPIVYSASSEQFFLARVAIFVLIGASIVVLTGWAGQLSLAQMAFVGVGAMATSALAQRGVPYGPAVCYATIAGVLLALLIGLPALRLKGLFLTVATLGFAVATNSYLLRTSMFRSGIGDAASITPGRFGPFDFGTYRGAYYGAVFASVLVLFVLRHLRTTGIGRKVLAVSGNERSAAAMTVNPAATKLAVFALSGGLATFAGGLLAAVMRTFRADLFAPEHSLEVLAMVAVGGIGSLAGALLGALYLVGLPALLGDSATIRLATSGIGLLLVLRLAPGGLASAYFAARDRLVRRLIGESAPTEPPMPTQVPFQLAVVPGARATEADLPEGTDRLAVERLLVQIGLRTIVADVSLRVAPGEIVGLIGTNGAGKSTIMDALSGFRPSEGSIRFDGQDIAHLPAVDRARLGIGRSFQAARLFPRLTVRECIQVSLEARRPTELVPSLLAFPPSVRTERWSRLEADRTMELFGLGLHADTLTERLSTGMRRVVELACLVAQRPRLVLLDEPLAGVAQREAEMFVPLLLEVRRQLDASILLIEHDVPVVVAISDRMYCLEAGMVIAEGPPASVRDDPRVVASYLGSDARSIERSGAGAS